MDILVKWKMLVPNWLINKLVSTFLIQHFCAHQNWPDESSSLGLGVIRKNSSLDCLDHRSYADNYLEGYGKTRMLCISTSF